LILVHCVPEGVDCHYDVKVSKIEQGIRPVFDYELGKLAEALKVSVEWLLGVDKAASK